MSQLEWQRVAERGQRGRASRRMIEPGRDCSLLEFQEGSTRVEVATPSLSLGSCEEAGAKLANRDRQQGRERPGKGGKCTPLLPFWKNHEPLSPLAFTLFLPLLPKRRPCSELICASRLRLQSDSRSGATLQFSSVYAASPSQHTVF